MGYESYKKQLIINLYLENTKRQTESIALELNCNESYVNKILRHYKEKITTRKKLYLVYSIDRNNLAFLFDGGAEKRIEIENNRIQNKTDFSDYELEWMRLNYKLE